MDWPGSELAGTVATLEPLGQLQLWERYLVRCLIQFLLDNPGSIDSSSQS